jgi:phospholipid/cholesterol/gamma-HCH transport system substrate-binding protein
MNERVMQFRIGMLVIVAGLVLTMLIVWFGEAPALFRDTVYVTAHYVDAPGVAEGIPVRKSGIRIGEVASIRFDDRAHQPDGVLVTLALERKYKVRGGSTPRISRALIGDVTIDMLPGNGVGTLPVSSTPGQSMMPGRIIEGTVAPDPTAALAAASDAFQKVGGTLQSIDAAAKGLAGMTDKTKDLEQTLLAFKDMGQKVSTLAADFDRVVKDNEGNIRPALESFRQASDRLSASFDEKARANLQATLQNAADGTGRFNQMMIDMSPVAKDLGAPSGQKAVTNTGQAMQRFNRVAYEFGLLTGNLADPNGGLNPNSSLAKLFTRTELYDNFNAMALGARETFSLARPVMKSFGRFADRIANDPGAISRGALERR